MNTGPVRRLRRGRFSVGWTVNLGKPIETAVADITLNTVLACVVFAATILNGQLGPKLVTMQPLFPGLPTVGNQSGNVFSDQGRDPGRFIAERPPGSRSLLRRLRHRLVPFRRGNTQAPTPSG
ncbi:MAG TPA: hypothetical protein VGN49_11515 [Micrococcaceae bacterium]|nr:hypothetical protein [Micrococcaceae bacterium]